ncbi:MAG: ribonuclease R [Bacteroidales bacterium]|jgi:ribonuclease R
MAKSKKKKNKDNKDKRKQLNKKALTNKVLGVFTNNPDSAFNYKQLAKELNLKDMSEKQLLVKVLDDLAASEVLKEARRGKYTMQSSGGYITGTVDLTASGAGFIITDELEQDVYVTQQNLNHALNGDKVKVYLYARKKKSRPEGEVVEIVERSQKQIVGVVDISKNYAFLVSNSRRMPYDLFIPLGKLNGAKNGDKVVAAITDWPAKYKNPFGEVLEVLGAPGENNVEMHAILAEFDLPTGFPESVDKVAEKVPDTITAADIKERRDMREVTTFTIDPFDAKDFDDALSIEKRDDGKWEIGVHIADVTHYVKPDSAIDKEGYERATSVYLVDRVVPMLPERLSNFICSLRPNEEKLTFSAVFVMDDEGEVHDTWLGRTIINSDKRFTYEDAQALIDGGDGPLKEEVLVLNSIAQNLRKKRFAKGSIAFDRVEVKFDLDETGKPLGVSFKEHGESNELVEEFMLLANRSVAEFVGNTPKGKSAKTFVYRIHDKPDSEKLQAFSKFIHRFGHQIQTTDTTSISKSINSLLEKVQGSKEQNLIETLAVRSMAKAEYATNNIGHYGLSFPFYTHFTSPIRRYPDMMVHRLLAEYLDGGRSRSKAKYEEMCQHSSQMEKRAENAERASIKYKQVEFLKEKIGQQFEGVISGVTEWGFYVELKENLCEGLVHIRELDDDFYLFDEDEYAIVGRRTKKTYQLGQQVRVQIGKADLERRQLDFLLVEE